MCGERRAVAKFFTNIVMVKGKGETPAVAVALLSLRDARTRASGPALL